MTVMQNSTSIMVEAAYSSTKSLLNNTELTPSLEEYYPYPDFSQIGSVRVAFIVVYLAVMVMAVSGNAVVSITVLTNRKMHTAVNYYIVNLAVSDFMVGIFVLPVKLLELTGPAEWGILNDGLCTAVTYFQTIFVFTSVLTLVAICIERYLAVVHPLKSRMQQTKSRAKKILLVTWMVPCLLAGPFLYPSTAVEHVLESHFGSITRQICYTPLPEEVRRAYYTFLFVLLYLLPLVFIAGTCFKVALCLLQEIPAQRQGSMRRHEANRRKVAKMVLVVVFAFVLCWTPYFLVTIVTQYQKENFMERENFFFTMLCINLLAFINSCVNPFIYCTMSTRFRHGFRRYFRLVLCLWACQEPTEVPHSDINLPPTPALKRGRNIRRPFQCQVPMSCLVTQSSSESGSGCPSDSLQQTAVNSSRNSILWSASQKFKRNFIVHYIQKDQTLQAKDSNVTHHGNLAYPFHKFFKTQKEESLVNHGKGSSTIPKRKNVFSKSANNLTTLSGSTDIGSWKKACSCSDICADNDLSCNHHFGIETNTGAIII